LQFSRVKVLGGLALFGGKLSSIVPGHIFQILDGVTRAWNKAG